MNSILSILKFQFQNICEFQSCARLQRNSRLYGTLCSVDSTVKEDHTSASWMCFAHALMRRALGHCTRNVNHFAYRLPFLRLFEQVVPSQARKHASTQVATNTAVGLRHPRHPVKGREEELEHVALLRLRQQRVQQGEEDRHRRHLLLFAFRCPGVVPSCLFNAIRSRRNDQLPETRRRDGREQVHHVHDDGSLLGGVLQRRREKQASDEDDKPVHDTLLVVRRRRSQREVVEYLQKSKPRLT